MPLFKKSTTSQDDVVPTFDNALDDVPLIQARDAARAGNPEPARDLLAATGSDWARREHRVSVLPEGVSDLVWLDRWVRDHPDEPTSVLLRGRAHIDLAWQARGRGWASSVTDEMWRKFRINIGIAERRLFEAADLLPEDPTPGSQLVIVGMAQSRPLDEVQHAFRGALARDRWHFGAHRNLQTALYAKWLGDPGMALSFARTTSAAAPPGEPVHALLVDAHREEQIALEVPAKEYWLRRDVRADILAAHERRFGGSSGEPSTWDIRDGNAFAIAFTAMHEYDLARAEFERIGRYTSEVHWRLFNNPARAFRGFRDDAYAVSGSSRGARGLQEKQATAQAVGR